VSKDETSTTNLELLSDEAAMVQYLNGNPAAFDLLYRRHSARILEYLRRRLKNTEEAHEAYQEVFLKLHKSKELYDRQQKFLPWLYVITKSVYLDSLRKNKGNPEQLRLAAEEIEQFPASPGTNVGTNLSLALQEAKSELSEEQQFALTLRHEEDLDFNEIAQRLNKSEVSVRKILSRAVGQLRKRLQSAEPKK
jgi:RNA polymerase sigma-70 factor (ECF subfamily)